MRCPVCEDQLRPLERDGVEIEMCPTCKGVWLDRGELDALMAGAGSNESRPKGDKPAEGKRKSGGLLGGLLDTIGGGGGD